MGKSLTNGDLKTAQSLFTSYEKMISGSSSLKAGSQFATDLATLSTALSKGDLSGAQAAYQTVSSDLTNNPAIQVANTEAATQQSVQWIEDLLSLSNSSSTSNGNSTDAATMILNAAYGSSSTSGSSDAVSSILNSAYGTSSSSTTDTAATDTASSGSNVSTTA
jgi:hypothetical protein